MKKNKNRISFFLVVVIFTAMICLTPSAAETPTPNLWRLKGLISAFEDENPKVGIAAIRFLSQRWNGFKSLVNEESSQNKELIQNISQSISLGFKSGDRGIRQNAIDALILMGPSGVSQAPAVFQLLKDYPRSYGKTVNDYIKKTGKSITAHAPVLIALLKDKNRSTRRDAALALGKMGDAVMTHASVFVNMLKEDNLEARLSAVLVLGLMGKSAASYAPDLIPLLKDEDYLVQGDVAKALGNMGESAASYAPDLIPLLKHKNFHVYDSVFEALKKMGSSAAAHASALTPLLKDDDPKVKERAIRVLGFMGEAVASHTPALGALLKDDDSGVREAAAQALGEMGKSAVAYIPDLIPLFKKEAPLRYTLHPVTEVLKKMDVSATDHAPLLIPLMKGKDEDVRREAIGVFGKWGASDASFGLALIPLLKDKDIEVRRTAIKTLGKMGESVAVHAPQLIPFLTDENKEVRSDAFSSLRNIGGTVAEHAPGLIELLKHKDKGVRHNVIYTLKYFGKSVASQAPALISLLEHKDKVIRQGAIQALKNLGEPVKEHILSLISLLEHKDINVSKSSTQVLRNLGRWVQKNAPDLIALLKNKNKEVRRNAVAVIKKMGNSATFSIPTLTPLLKSEDEIVRQCVAQALGVMGDAAATQAPALGALLKDKDSGVRQSAAWALGEMGEPAAAQASVLGALLMDKDDHKGVRIMAAKALEKMGESAAKQLPILIPLLKDKDWEIRNRIVKVIESIGKSAKAYVPKLIALLKKEELKEKIKVRRSVAQVLSKLVESESDLIALLKDEDKSVRKFGQDALQRFGKSPKDHKKVFSLLLKNKDSEILESTVNALVKRGEAVSVHAPALIALLTDDKGRYSSVSQSSVRALKDMGESIAIHAPSIAQKWKYLHPRLKSGVQELLISLGPLEAPFLPNFLEVLYGHDNPLFGESRFLAHLMGGGATDARTLMHSLGHENPKTYDELVNTSHFKVREALSLYQRLWDPSKELEKFRSELSTEIGNITHGIKNWGKEDQDLKLLKSLTQLDKLDPGVKLLIQSEINALEEENEFMQIIQRSGFAISSHALFWLVLIFYYPRSRFVQAMFFWNPLFRKLLGFGYINFALTWVPFLRRRLFAPFKESMEADAQIDAFKEQEYFTQTEVEDEVEKKKSLLVETLENFKGQIILEGPSGLGKSMFLRRWVKNSKSIVVFLPAAQCSEGPLNAISVRTKGVAQDERYLKQLIYAGAIDVCIDGVNEVSAAVRESIVSFMREMGGANIIVTTQRMVWNPPATAKRFLIKPLKPDMVEAFLISRYPFLEGKDLVSEEEYSKDIQGFLEKELGEQQPKDLLESSQIILSNPMDLSVVASMLARKQNPDLFRLLEQQFKEMAKDYMETHGREFPLEAFSEEAYRARVSSENPSLDDKKFEAELLCMERHKMAFNYSFETQSQWKFRHDKIWEYFIAQTFMAGKTMDEDEATTRLDGHLGNSQFNGVYFLLAMLMDLKDAEMLKEKLVDYVVDTNDNTVLAGFVQNLRFRKSA